METEARTPPEDWSSGSVLARFSHRSGCTASRGRANGRDGYSPRSTAAIVPHEIPASRALRHRRCDVLVDEISGRIARASELVEVGQRQRVEDAEIVSAKSHGEIMAPTRRRRYPRGYGPAAGWPHERPRPGDAVGARVGSRPRTSGRAGGRVAARPRARTVARHRDRVCRPRTRGVRAAGAAHGTRPARDAHRVRPRPRRVPRPSPATRPARRPRRRAVHDHHARPVAVATCPTDSPPAGSSTARAPPTPSTTARGSPPRAPPGCSATMRCSTPSRRHPDIAGAASAGTS